MLVLSLQNKYLQAFFMYNRYKKVFCILSIILVYRTKVNIVRKKNRNTFIKIVIFIVELSYDTK